MTHEPRSRDFEQRVRTGFSGQAFMEYLGARLTAVAPGSIEITLDFRREFTQQHGFYHGGLVGTLADNAAGFAAFSLMSDEEQPLSVEMKVNLLRKGAGDRLIARGRVVRNGRVLKVCQSDVFVVNGGREEHCATALVTIMALRDLMDPSDVSAGD